MDKELSNKQGRKVTIFALFLSLISIGILVLGFLIVSSNKVILLQSISNLYKTFVDKEDMDLSLIDKLATAKKIGIKANINIPLNLEMAATDEIQKFALKIVPNSCCLVPEKRMEITTEGGLNVAGQINYLKEYIKPLQDKGILISLFIDPEEKQVDAAAKIGADYIEMHTGSYSEAYLDSVAQEIEFKKLKNAAIQAQSLGLKVNAGHGLNYQNVIRMKEIPNICELNIGHSIISLAVFEGLEAAVIKMKDLIS